MIEEISQQKLTKVDLFDGLFTLCAGGMPEMRNRYLSTNSWKEWRMG